MTCALRTSNRNFFLPITPKASNTRSLFPATSCEVSHGWSASGTLLGHAENDITRWQVRVAIGIPAQTWLVRSEYRPPFRTRTVPSPVVTRHRVVVGMALLLSPETSIPAPPPGSAAPCAAGRRAGRSSETRAPGHASASRCRAIRALWCDRPTARRS